MIFDCFPFFKELDLLEMRLSILENVVDRFVLCESPYTFRGVRKPLFYAEHRARFARWNDRITHLVYDEPPRADPWINDWRQRGYLNAGLSDAAPGDLVISSDLDEIPAPENVARFPSPGRILAHRQIAARGYFNRIASERWIGTRSFAYRDLGARNLNDIRFVRWGDELEYVDGGWHFTSLGGAEVIAEKFGALAHFEADVAYFNDRGRLAVEFATESGAHWVPFDDRFPAQLHEPRWAHYIWPQPEPLSPERTAALVHAYGCLAYVPPDAAIAVLAADDDDAWRRAGVDRFGAAFAGTFETAEALVEGVRSDAWVVVDGLERLSDAAFRLLSTAGHPVAAFARNARSFAAVDAVINGASFPRGRALGVPEMERAIGAAGFVVERRDFIGGALAFPPSTLPEVEPFGLDLGSMQFSAVTRAWLDTFVAHAVMWVLRPAAR